MKSLRISGYTFSTTSVPTSPALRVESGTGTYYVNLTTGQRPEALSDQKVFTISTTNYSFLRPFVTSNSFMGYSGISNNSALTTGYSGVSNNSTVTTGYAGVSSRSSTYGYSGYSSFTSNIIATVATLNVSMRTEFIYSINVHSYMATFSPIAPYRASWYDVFTTGVNSYSTYKGKVLVLGLGGPVDRPYALFTINNVTREYTVYLTKNYTGTTAFTGTAVKSTKVSKTTYRNGVLLSQVPLTRSSTYNSSSTAIGNLSNTTALTKTATRYSSSTAKGYLSSITNLTESTTRYSSSVAVGNLSNTTELRTITRL